MLRSLGLALLLTALSAASAGAATLTPIGSFDQPIFVTSDPADSSRIFVVERPGRVAEVSDEGTKPYADLTGLVACCSSERGLLSIAPAPDFHQSGLFYAAYTGKQAAGGSEGDIHVDAIVADADAKVTRTPIISVGHSQQANHNGGQLQFGPDGYLYISTGDGGGGGDPFATGQDVNALLGKILRIDPDSDSTERYSIPPGNPFASGPGADEVWAFGVRNPWRFSFDSLTGDMLIGDVGQGSREEVDLAPSPSAGVVGGAGANYGWSCREGLIAYSSPAPNCAGASGFVDPIFDYPHTDPDPPADRAYGCSITGGYVVRDPSLTDLYGRYVYADYCSSEIRALTLPTGTAPAVDQTAAIATPASNPTSFGEDSCHRLYVAAGSNVYRFKGSGTPVCPDPPGEEPPPKEEPPTVTPKTDTPVERSAPPIRGPEAAEIRLGAGRRGDRLLLTVHVGPCAIWAGARVQLNRGGRRVASKRLGEACRAVFRMADPGRATFRALVEVGGGTTIRSRRFVLEPAGR